MTKLNKLRKVTYKIIKYILIMSITSLYVDSMANAYAGRIGKSSSVRVSKVNKISSQKHRSRFGQGIVAGAAIATLLSKKNPSYAEVVDTKDEETEPNFIPYKELRQLHATHELKKYVESTQYELVDIREQQILNKIIKKVKEDYISELMMELILVKERPLEAKESSDQFLLPILGKYKMGSKIRKEIKYRIKLTSDSPNKMDDFNILSINGENNMLVNPLLTYQEKWGLNVITVKLQNKKAPDFIFKLSKCYYLG